MNGSTSQRRRGRRHHQKEEGTAAPFPRVRARRRKEGKQHPLPKRSPLHFTLGYLNLHHPRGQRKAASPKTRAEMAAPLKRRNQHLTTEGWECSTTQGGGGGGTTLLYLPLVYCTSVAILAQGFLFCCGFVFRSRFRQSSLWFVVVVLTAQFRRNFLQSIGADDHSN